MADNSIKEPDSSGRLGIGDSATILGLLLGVFFVLIVPPLPVKIFLLLGISAGFAWFAKTSHWTHSWTKRKQNWVAVGVVLLALTLSVPQFLSQWKQEHPPNTAKGGKATLRNDGKTATGSADSKPMLTSETVNRGAMAVSHHIKGETVHPKIAVLLECQQRALPVEWKDQRLYLMETYLPPSAPPLGQIMSGLYSNEQATPGPWMWGSDNRGDFVTKCEFTNYGDSPIVFLSAVFHLTFLQAISDSTKNEIRGGAIAAEREYRWVVPEKIEGNAGKFSFLVHNHGNYFVQITQPTIATVRFFGSQKEQQVALEHSTSASIMGEIILGPPREHPLASQQAPPRSESSPTMDELAAMIAKKLAQQETIKSGRIKSESSKTCRGDQLAECDDAELLQWGYSLLQRISEVQIKYVESSKAREKIQDKSRWRKSTEYEMQTLVNDFRDCCADDALKYQKELALRLGGGLQHNNSYDWTENLLKSPESREGKLAREEGPFKITDVSANLLRLHLKLESKIKSVNGQK